MAQSGEPHGNDRATVGHFDRVHGAQLQSPTLRRIWQSAYGDEYPDEATPSAFYPRSTLQRLMTLLNVRAGQTLVDLGCGNGGAGLWLARQRGAKLIGIDLSEAGVAAAKERADRLEIGNSSQFRRGDMTATGLSSASCDAAVSLDVLCFVADKAAAINEVARVLRPGARFGFTTWEQEGYSERLRAPQLADHRPVLRKAGFEVEVYDEPIDWRRQQRAVLEGLLASEETLARELGPSMADDYKTLARGMLSDMAKRRYVLVCARRV